MRDVADIHIRAMTSPAAAGQRFLATGEFMWMDDIARVLRADLGDDARKVPTRNLPDAVVRAMARRQARAAKGSCPGSAGRTATPRPRPKALLGLEAAPGGRHRPRLRAQPHRAPARSRWSPPGRTPARNRAPLIEAAREVFAERGLGATLDDIAERAGVGTGTAYRHFRNKQEIAAEVLAGATQQIVTDAEDALAIKDPWQAIVTFFETTAERQAADRGLYQTLAGQGNVDDKVRIWPQIVSAVTKLFDRAKKAKVIRADARAGGRGA